MFWCSSTQEISLIHTTHTHTRIESKPSARKHTHTCTHFQFRAPCVKIGCSWWGQFTKLEPWPRSHPSNFDTSLNVKKVVLFFLISIHTCSVYEDETLPEAQNVLQCYAIKGGHILKQRDKRLARFGSTKIRLKNAFSFRFGSILALSFQRQTLRTG